jgi:hypothetical protein
MSVGTHVASHRGDGSSTALRRSEDLSHRKTRSDSPTPRDTTLFDALEKRRSKLGLVNRLCGSDWIVVAHRESQSTEREPLRSCPKHVENPDAFSGLEIAKLTHLRCTPSCMSNVQDNVGPKRRQVHPVVRLLSGGVGSYFTRVQVT